MFDINRTPLSAEIRCRDCRAALTVNSDDRRTIDRSITQFEKNHHCRPDRMGHQEE